jgi:hypothetical protein
VPERAKNDKINERHKTRKIIAFNTKLGGVIMAKVRVKTGPKKTATSKKSPANKAKAKPATGKKTTAQRAKPIAQAKTKT